METSSLKRHLAAVLYADVAGYSRLTGDDEEGTHRRLGAGLDTLTAAVERHGGRVVHFAGDAVLAEFASAVQALACAGDAQAALLAANRDLPPERRLEFRVGLNLGDVIDDRDDIYGEGVNVAARLEALADPGGICISESLRDAVGNKLPYRYEFIGERRVKNIATPVRAYRVLPHDGEARTDLRALLAGRRRRAVVFAAVAGLAALAGLALFKGPPALDGLLGETSTGAGAPAAAPARALSALPSIAVLPFRNLSTDPAQAYFSDGLTEDIITELSRFPELLVIASGSAFAYRASASSDEQIARELDARYLLEGSAERTPSAVRISVQLVDAANGVRLWAERFDRTPQDLFRARDEIVRSVVATLAVRIEEIERERVRHAGGEALAAYDHVLQGRERLARGTREGNVEARALFRRALDADPGSASAHIGLGEAHRQALRYGWAESPERELAQLEDAAREALRADAASAGGHQLLGYAYQLRGRLNLALAEYARALELNPNDAESYAGYGLTLMFVGGRTDDALEALETARRLDPHMRPSDSVRSRSWTLALAYYLHGRYDDAITVLEQALAWFPNHSGTRALLAAAYAQRGRTADAERAARAVRQSDPFFDTARFGTGLGSEADRERLRAGLRRAGLE